MRVLVVTPWFPTEDAPGAGVFNLRDVELLSEEHEVRVLHFDVSAGKSPAVSWVPKDGYELKRVRFGPAALGRYPSAIRALTEALSWADLLHTMAFPALLPSWLARWNPAARTPWVHTEHWSGVVGKATSVRARLGKAALLPLLNKPDQVVAVGSGLAESIEKTRGSAVSVIGNHVRLGHDKVLPESPRVRGGGTLRIIGVGNLIPWKGPLEAVGAVAELNARGISAELKWAGVGPLHSNVLNEAKRLGIERKVTLLGHLKPEELSRELVSAHLFLLPTEGETFGVAIAEALGHGLPVVTSGRGGHEGFLPAKASRIVSSRTALSLAQAAEELIEDPALETPEQIASFARAAFSEGRRKRDYEAVYGLAFGSG